MKVISQNLLNYGVKVGLNSILRVNLAWQEDIESAERLLKSLRGRRIYLDVPEGRKKPPNNQHDIQEIKKLVDRMSHVEFVAISNIENANQVIYYQNIFKGRIVVPKIESYIGIRNAGGIIKAIFGTKPVIMLDHQDLFSDLVGMGKEGEFTELLDGLKKTCQEHGAALLITVGIVFSDKEKEAK